MLGAVDHFVTADRVVQIQLERSQLMGLHLFTFQRRNIASESTPLGSSSQALLPAGSVSLIRVCDLYLRGPECQNDSTENGHYGGNKEYWAKEKCYNLIW